MQKIFKHTNLLDKRACEKFLLSEEILMENAAQGMSEYLKQRFSKKSNILILCGGGNNGADGYALARMIFGFFNVCILEVYQAKSSLAKLQAQRARALDIKFVDKITDADIYVDSIFGSGQREEIDKRVKNLLLQVNEKKGFKVACDIPTGIYSNIIFKANITFSMGALKEVLFLDNSKDFVGKIKCIDLGISRSVFEESSNTYLLEKSDLNLPIRRRKNTNKGDFGYLSIIGGEQEGASVLSALAAFNMGAGLVSLVGAKNTKIPHCIMKTNSISKKTTAILAGMGLGKTEIDKQYFFKYPSVLDADLLHQDFIKDILKHNNNIVLTPHPKEFVSLLKIFDIGTFSIDEVQANRFDLVRKFCATCKNVVLVLKGANTIIAQNEKLYVCDIGTQSLAKGGSGDVLAGFIASLFAQGRSGLDASINGVLAHSLIAKKYKGKNYSLTPNDLIEGVKWL